MRGQGKTVGMFAVRQAFNASHCRPGEVLGLSALLCSGPYELTAEIVDDARVAMINRKDLLQFLNDHRETCLQLAQLLSHDLHVAYNRMRVIGLGRGRRRRQLLPVEVRLPALPVTAQKGNARP